MITQGDFRKLLYVADVYSDYTKDMNLYGTKAVKLPTPRFVIFYNGQAEQPDRKELKLSELFSIPDADPSLELKAVMLNINKGHNRKLMETCRTLQDYAEYTFRTRFWKKRISRSEPLHISAQKISGQPCTFPGQGLPGIFFRDACRIQGRVFSPSLLTALFHRLFQ